MSQYFKVTPPALPERRAPEPAVRGPQLSAIAIVSLVLGLVSFPAMCLGAPLAMLGLSLGIAAIVSIRRSAGSRKGLPFAVAGVVTSLAWFGVVGPVFLELRRNFAEFAEVARNLPESPTKQAEANLRASAGDQVAFGNNPEAEILASIMLEEIRMYRESAFTKGPASSRGEFRVHCELHEDTCAFLVHVPDLHTFVADAEEDINEMAWIIAQEILEESEFPDGGRLAVGLKGTINLQDVQTGRHFKGWDDDKEIEAGERDIVTDWDLGEFFPNSTKLPPETELSPSESEDAGHQGLIPPDPTAQPASK